ncbi:MAG TPA: SRPBCC family protein [Burkholderiaceae bacterium]|nr:SRPBCC family protein [Burkholderiaceae bacterium]
MKVQLEKTFPMPASADVAWALLHDLQAVAQCMPGAAITERIDERHFKGTVTVRIGPASMSFRGEVELKEIDAAARTLRLLGKGTDSTGTSGASMDLTARIEAAGDLSNLVGTSEVSMSGKAAAFGGRAMTTVADQVLKQFAGNFATRVTSLAGGSPSGASPPADGAEAPGAPAAAAPPPAVSHRSRELNGLALMWAVFRDWLRALFGKSPA